MAYTVRKLLEANQFPDMKLVTGENELDREIKGIRIVEIEDMERYLTGEEILLTSLKVYFGEREREFRKHLEELEKKHISGFIIKQHPDMVQKVNYYEILLKFCSEHQIPVLEIPENEYYWDIIKHVVLQVFDKSTARLTYFKLTHDNITNMLLKGKNYENATRNIIYLVAAMIGNPVALYYSNLACFASSDHDMSAFQFAPNAKPYKPDIITRFQYLKQETDRIQYIVKIDIFGEVEVYLVVTEANAPLTGLDYMALENAIITLQYGFLGTYTQNEIEKKYQRDIGYSMLNGLLPNNEIDDVAHMLNLKDTAQYCVVSFHTIPKNKQGHYTAVQLEEVGVIEGEIQELLPDEHIYRNLNQIVCIHEIRPGETQSSFREEMDKLYETVQKQILHRKKKTDFQIGIGSIVTGYRDLKTSFQESKKIIEYDIPLCAQVVGLVDAYDALISERPYKRKLSHEQAIRMIVNGECGVFSVKLLQCFLAATMQNEWKMKVKTTQEE